MDAALLGVHDRCCKASGGVNNRDRGKDAACVCFTIDQGGSTMTRVTPKELLKRRQEFQEEAGRTFDQMLGSDGQNGLVTFTDREDRACELGDALTRRLL